MKLIYAGFSDKGLKREINQDALFMQSRSDMGLFCVADGMGGHSHGEYASTKIIEYLGDWWNDFDESRYDNNFMNMMVSMEKCLEKANKAIYEKGKEGQICGSTVVVLFIFEDSVGVLWAGDSRIYRKSKLRVGRMTADETWERKASNRLSEKEKIKNSNYGKLVNAIGVNAEVKLNMRTDILKKRDIFMLCSDGIYKYFDEALLVKMIRKTSYSRFEDILNKIKKEAYDKGAGDNLSAIFVGTVGL